MYPSFQNKRYVIKVIILYVLERKITDLKIRGVVILPWQGLATFVTHRSLGERRCGVVC